jgi:hypothetical protein
MRDSPPQWLRDRLGPRPTGLGGVVWNEAAGRAAQHHTAYELPDTTCLGPQPRIIDRDAYATSHRHCVDAMARLTEIVGRTHAIETPGRSLGIEL